ncbi:hypothetical protein ES702_07018 [subsurface metagenome]
MPLLAKYGASGWTPRGRITYSNGNKHTTFKYNVNTKGAYRKCHADTRY